MESVKRKRNFRRIMKLFKIFSLVRFTTGKVVHKIYAKNILYELPHKSPNDLKLYGKTFKMGGGKA